MIKPKVTSENTDYSNPSASDLIFRVRVHTIRVNPPP